MQACGNAYENGLVYEYIRAVPAFFVMHIYIYICICSMENKIILGLMVSLVSKFFFQTNLKPLNQNIIMSMCHIEQRVAHRFM